MKKILAVLIVLFLLFVAVLVAFPIYIKPKLVEATKSMLNEQIDVQDGTLMGCLRRRELYSLKTRNNAKAHVNTVTEYLGTH